jgi:hypothetical protein
LNQRGPPEWIWERPPEKLKWEIVTPTDLEGRTVFELRMQAGGGDHAAAILQQ